MVCKKLEKRLDKAWQRLVSSVVASNSKKGISQYDADTAAVDLLETLIKIHEAQQAMQQPPVAAEDPSRESISKAIHAIWDRVTQACKDAGHKEVYVTYSAYDSGDDDIPIDNLDQVAAPGKVVLIQEADEFYGGEKSKDYRSPVLESPTWLQVAVYANEMIRRTRDTHHCFLEGIGKVMEEGDVTIYEFSMGS